MNNGLAESGRWKSLAKLPIAAAFLSGATAKVAVTLINLLVVAVSVRALGIDGFGVITVFTGLTGLFGFLDLGIGNGVMTDLSANAERGDQNATDRLISSALLTLLCISLLTLCAGVVGALSVPTEWFFEAPGISDSQLRACLAVFVISVAVSVPSTLGAKLALAAERGAVNSVYLAIGSLGSLVGVLLCACFELPLWSFVACLTLIPAAISVVQTVIYVRRLTEKLTWSNVSRSSILTLGSSSFSFFLLAVCAAVALQSSTTIVAYCLGAGAAGVLGVSLRMFGLVSGLFTTGIQQLWATMARGMERGDRVSVANNARITIGASAAVATSLSVLLVLVGHILARVWVGNSGIPSSSLLAVTAVYTVYSFVMTQFSFILNAARRVLRQAAVSLIAVAAQIPLAVVLTVKIGPEGALIGFLLSHFIFVGIPTLSWARQAFSMNDKLWSTKSEVAT